MNKQLKNIERFKLLHIKGEPLILFNIWDAGSARTLQETNVKSIATSSLAVAAAASLVV